MTLTLLINTAVALVGVPLKSCSKNMQQSYKRTTMSKRDVNEVGKHY